MAGFIGIDPRGLIALADTADQYATRIGLVRNNSIGVLARYRFAEKSAIDSRLAGSQLSITDESHKLRWRAGVIEDAQNVRASTTDLIARIGVDVFAATAVFDLGTWRSDYDRWRLERTLQALVTMEPTERAGMFVGMNPLDAVELLRLYPETIGAMDGAPTPLRYAANRALIRREITRLEDYMKRLQATDIEMQPEKLAPLMERVDEYRRWLDENRQILLFDPSGDGRVVEVFGDLDTATRIAVVVPGMANDIGNYSEGDGGFRANARDLFDATSRVGIATVAWLGYDSPDNIGAITRSSANDGAPLLQRFLEGIDPERDGSITVIAHSYGSVLAGTAARSGLEADDLVFVGSPGTTLDSAGDAVLRTDSRVWVALADMDPIALGINPSELPPWWLPPAFWIPWVANDFAQDGAEELWHGTNPAGVDFGARQITTGGCTGHSSYFEAEALENLAKIVEGRYDDVELVDPSPVSGAW